MNAGQDETTAHLEFTLAPAANGPTLQRIACRIVVVRTAAKTFGPRIEISRTALAGGFRTNRGLAPDG